MKRKLWGRLFVAIISVVILCSVSVTAWAANDTVIKNDEMGIPDVNLYNAILETADSNNDGVLTVAEAEAITELSVALCNVKNLTGIENLKNLTCIDLWNNNIYDISPLATLTKLKTLHLGTNQIEDISVLAHLKELESLSLSVNEISNVSALSNLKELNYLSLEVNQIKDISALSNLYSLEELMLDGNKIVNLNSLSRLNELKVLSLSVNEIVDVSPLANLKNLTLLNLENNQIKDATPLKALPSTCKIYLDGNPCGELDNSTQPDTPSSIPEIGWYEGNGTKYWYEDGIRQGTYDDPKGVLGDGTVRGREIYDPESDGWYWLDAVYDGAKAVNKEVWMPYIYQNEADWGAEEIAMNASASGDMAEQVIREINNRSGKWVRYDENGKMYKGWYTVEGTQASIYPDQEGNTYYYDPKTGLMAKGEVTIDGQTYYFDEITGVLQ